MEARDALLAANGLGLPIHETERQAAARLEHAGQMLVRIAAAKAGILSSQLNENGGIVEDDPRRFGFHNLRHSLASFLVRSKTDQKTVQALLRHSDVRTTLQLYAHSVTEDRLAAQETALHAILGNGNLLAGTANG